MKTEGFLKTKKNRPKFTIKKQRLQGQYLELFVFFLKKKVSHWLPPPPD